MTGDLLEVAPDPEAVPLGRADVPEMLDLTARTKPGPFLPRTYELGTYLGIRRHGKLVALAGHGSAGPPSGPAGGSAGGTSADAAAVPASTVPA